MVTALHSALADAQRLRGQTIVVKTGGELLQDDRWLAALVADGVALHRMGVRIVWVHGGGPQLDDQAATDGLVTERVAGRRITSGPLLDAAIRTWRGTLSAQLVSAIQAAGEPAVGLAGYDGGLVSAARRPPVRTTTDAGDDVEVDYGHVGDVTGVNVALLDAVAAHAMVVISPLAAGPAGDVLNVNADTVAAEVAVAVGASALVLLTQAPGILTDVSDLTSVLPRVDLSTCDTLLASGAIQGGMRPKLAAIRRAIEGGVPRAHVVDGRVEGVLLDELLTHEGRGTLVVP